MHLLDRLILFVAAPYVIGNSLAQWFLRPLTEGEYLVLILQGLVVAYLLHKYRKKP